MPLPCTSIGSCLEKSRGECMNAALDKPAVLITSCCSSRVPGLFVWQNEERRTCSHLRTKWVCRVLQQTQTDKGVPPKASKWSIYSFDSKMSTESVHQVFETDFCCPSCRFPSPCLQSLRSWWRPEITPARRLRVSSNNTSLFWVKNRHCTTCRSHRTAARGTNASWLFNLLQQQKWDLMRKLIESSYTALSNTLCEEWFLKCENADQCCYIFFCTRLFEICSRNKNTAIYFREMTLKTIRAADYWQYTFSFNSNCSKFVPFGVHPVCEGSLWFLNEPEWMNDIYHTFLPIQ